MCKIPLLNRILYKMEEEHVCKLKDTVLLYEMFRTVMTKSSQIVETIVF